MPSIGVTGEVSETKQFEWKISNFFTLAAEKGSCYSSPSFVFNNTSFHLDIYPDGCISAKSGYISVFLVNENNSPVRMAHEWYIKKADNTLTACLVHNYVFSHGYFVHDFYNKSVLLEYKIELVPSDILTIVCILKSIKAGKETPGKTDNAEILHEDKIPKTLDYRRLTDLDTLSENLKDLSVNKEGSDVVLQVEDKEFKAHKAILMARSPVFAAMFKHDTLEKKTGIINVQDCDPETFQEFLDFLYSGKLEDVSFGSAFHLYSTSHKYEVLKLQEFCTKYLIESLTTENVCDIVELADKYDETVLIAEAQNFFNEYVFQIFPTAGWQRLTTNNMRLSNKLLIECSKAKGSQ